MFKNKAFVVICIVVVLVVVAIAAIKVRSSEEKLNTSAVATYEVKQGPLTISVIESGTIKAREQIILKSEVEGKTSIIYLIEEGMNVKKGDLLVELDASTLLDDEIDEEIKTLNAEAAFISARENLAVVQNQAKSDVDIAKLTLTFAKQDLEKYTKGEYLNEKKKADTDITLAKSELTQATETLEWSQKLYDEKYISQTELEADKLLQKKKELDLELAESNLDLLTKYTYRRNVDQLVSDANQAGMALERTQRKVNADLAQAEATLKAREAEYRQQESKLKKTKEQIVKTKIYAPADGLAIYATSAKSRGRPGSQEPLDEGQAVYERQELIYLPTAASSKAEVDIHESNLEKVHPGLPAIITVDALQGRRYLGTVERIAPLPDAQSVWMNPDLKVYNTEIYLDSNDPLLRTGMSCLAEIVVARYDDAVYVPVQAVMRVDGAPTVYVVKDKSIEPRKVESGLDNNRMIHIVSGLEKGEVVSLTPPLQSAEVDQGGTGLGNGYNGNGSLTSSELIDKEIDDRLKQSKEASSQVKPSSVKRDRKTGKRDGRDGRKNRNLSDEERQKMRQRFQNMSDEEKQKMRQGDTKTETTRPRAESKDNTNAD